MRDQWQSSKHDVAEAFRGDTLTDMQTSELLSPFASHFDEMRAATGAAMQQIHEALDPRQRGILADLMERGWGRF
jgi:hypothetical protein